MPRYVAFLRGVSPQNASMPALRQCFESAGFTEVRTLLSSGNVVFNARSSPIGTLQRRCEKAMQTDLPQGFCTIIRPALHLQALLAADPFAGFDLPASAKRIVTFLRTPPQAVVQLPIERDDAVILKLDGAEVFSAYVPGDKGPVFMNLIERTFGKDVTTRTLDTVRKCAQA
ncbi:MAG: DUF1697 domain-containing protein [Ramlibacter sp.]